MKSLTAVLVVLVVLSLIFSLTALIIVVEDKNIFAPNPPTTPNYTQPPTITNPPQPTPNYLGSLTVFPTSIWHGTQYAVNGNITHLDPSFEEEMTWVIFRFDLLAAETGQFDLADFTLTINGQAPNIIYSNGAPLYIYKDQINECSIWFYVAGAYAGGFELIYNGPADVKINPMPPQTPNPPQPTPTQPPQTDLTLSYTETSRVENNGRTKITLTIDVKYISGSTTTIDYSQFYLGLYVGRHIYWLGYGTAEPQNSGSFTLGPLHQKQTFQLIFEFPTTHNNGMDGERSTVYQLGYNGAATIQWINQDYRAPPKL